ncbi:hybrid sensor histidine kinase/response regulator [Pseudoxanthomonas koreensis]|uniref:hybrid sensor histidine kinase/response regulator n=1 Tax=Pseudoxanthomonas koreensis TaxID=266061 RepID=UPI001390D506|nr:PAS-domain containing protein [Pseudoxanthomonas koreensis]KAF1693694.1 hybrid sensor histidine kinase/response regulator [Pseudoxanthomonas koreensis]
MLSLGLVAVAGVLWLALMFGTALYGERRPALFARHWNHVYALSLAVHCTSWTFYGTVTQAARYGWPLPPTFVGAILFYALAMGFMVRLVRLARETNATSLADLIATRLGKDAWLAATVTVVAALGLIPYIALQLKAVAMSFATLTRSGVENGPFWRDSALYVALAMALFAMLFGTRRASAAEHNRGLVLAMAVESVFKLAAMLALGAFVWFGLDALPEIAAAPPPASPAAPVGGFLPLVLLGALAMFILPHQFHVGVVECRDERDVRTARWLFPLYLLLIAAPTLPLAHAGRALLGDDVPSDMYSLALPVSQGHEGVALFAFLGGLSAATGMVVVSTLTLSLMIGNHWFAPGLLRGAWARGDGGDRRGDLIRLRRAGIAAIMLLAWAYSRLVAGNEALADVGALSFSALATLAPVLAFAVWRPQTPPRAAIAGVIAAFLTWAWVLMTPTVAAAAALDAHWIEHGPFGQRWLAPGGLFGLTGWSPLGRAVGASLFMGTLVTLLAMAWRREAPHRASRNLDADALRDAGRRFLPGDKVAELLASAPRSGPVPALVEARVERELSAVLGAASARLLLDAARRESGDLDTVAAIVGEASQDLRFNQQVLQAALQNMSQGISVIDREQRLVAWNRRYVELFGFPEELLQVGRPIAELTAWFLRRQAPGGLEARQFAKAIERRLAFMRHGSPHLTERVFPDGSIVEIRGNPMPGGGFVATFTDVTAFREAERGLIRANETLEQRVVERTALLETAKQEAEHANDAKSRFLAAIGHDLLQPLHAAQLFVDSLSQQISGAPDAQAAPAHAPPPRETLRQLGGALDSTTDLLTGLLDMSRLEAGGLVPAPRDFPLDEVLAPLAEQFRAMAGERGLAFAYRPTALWVHSDPQLLRRVLQNFLGNAVRYTARGRVVLGARRGDGRVRIEVHDTGPGVPEAARAAIFEEFRRGEDAPGQGLGLGLSIADRIAGLLQAPLTLRSVEGRGSVFAVDVARAQAPAAARPVAAVAAGKVRGLAGRRILLVDNDADALAALAQLLAGWGCEVAPAADGDGAAAALAQRPADLWLFDYHLDRGDTGALLAARLRGRYGPAPCLILSADAGEATRSAVQEAELALLPKPVRPLALKSVLDRMLAATRR